MASRRRRRKILKQAIARLDPAKELDPKSVAAAKRVARSQEPTPAAWQILIAAGELVDQMPKEQAHALLGPAHPISGTATSWRPGGPQHEGTRALYAVANPDGTYSSWQILVLKR